MVPCESSTLPCGWVDVSSHWQIHRQKQQFGALLLGCAGKTAKKRNGFGAHRDCSLPWTKNFPDGSRKNQKHTTNIDNEIKQPHTQKRGQKAKHKLAVSPVLALTIVPTPDIYWFLFLSIPSIPSQAMRDQTRHTTPPTMALMLLVLVLLNAIISEASLFSNQTAKVSREKREARHGVALSTTSKRVQVFVMLTPRAVSSSIQPIPLFAVSLQ